MQRRAVRNVVLAVLLALGAGAAVETWGGARRLQTLEAEHRELTNRIERIQGAVTFIAAAQNTYIGSGQPDELTLDRVSVLVQQMTGDTEVVRTRIRGANSPSHLQEFADGLAALITADERARQHLGAGQALAAADVIFRETRDGVALMDAKLRELRYAETGVTDADRRGLIRRAQWSIGGVGLLWTLGLVLFARTSAREPLPAFLSELPTHEESAPAQRPAATVETTAPPVDLAGVAEVCTAISRVGDAAELPALLARAGALLDAPGLIVWMGAGDELFAATASGYDPAILARLGSIRRTAGNATAAAWRTGELRVVEGDDSGTGAVVAPMFGTAGCVGVLAVEVRNGREQDAATRAVVSMLAAQLATVLSAWPAASSSSEPAFEARGSASERHAAAS